MRASACACLRVRVCVCVCVCVCVRVCACNHNLEMMKVELGMFVNTQAPPFPLPNVTDFTWADHGAVTPVQQQGMHVPSLLTASANRAVFRSFQDFSMRE